MGDRERAEAVCKELSERGADFLSEVDAEDVITAALRSVREEEMRRCLEVVWGQRQHMPDGIEDPVEYDSIQANNTACARIATAIESGSERAT